MALQPWRELAADIAALGIPAAGVDIVSAARAPGRILAEPVRAARPLPPHDHAVMDGFALGAPPPGRYRLLQAKPARLASDEAAAIKAGEAAPPGTTAVALAARAARDGEHILLSEPLGRDNLRRAGEEAVAGDEIIAPGARLDPRHVALASAAGVSAFAVRRRPRVALLALTDAAEPLPHATALAALVAGGGVAFDDPLTLRAPRLAAQLLRLAPAHDLIVVAAESLDAEDGPLAAAIQACGSVARIGRAALKPAKPVVFGRIDSAAVVGLAGTAYAAVVAAHLFLRPLLLRLAGLGTGDLLTPATADFARARAPSGDMPGAVRRAEALPVVMSRAGPDRRVSPAGRFGQLTALAAMDGFALVESDSGVIAPGDPVLYHPLSMPLI